MTKRLILPVMIVGIFFAAASISFAQQNIPGDTMRVMDNFGRPGDTITVSFYIENSEIVIGGYSAVIFFNPSMLDFVDADKVGRNGDTLDVLGSAVHRDSLLVLVAYSLHPDWPGHVLHHGRGAVAQIRVRIRPTVPFGTRTYMRFGIDPNQEFFSGWADTTGSGAEWYPSLVDGFITVTGGSSNQPPVIGSIGPQEVREGQTLQFGVNAYDLNGDNITLSAQDLPANAFFPTVQGDSVATGMFTFTPDFQQGPDTFYVTFVASDDHNNTTTLTVPIVVLATPNDFLSIDPHQGGIPGASGREVNIDLTNAHNIYGLQFNYYYDQNMVDVVDVIPTERALGLGFWYTEPVPGTIVVLIFSTGLDPILPGDGPIAHAVTNVNSTALFGPTPVVLDSAIEVIDSIGTSRFLIMNDGYFTVDRFGDANLDGHVDVGDCVTIIAYIVESYPLSVRQFDAADINRDTRVTVGDLQAVIDYILRIPTSPGPTPPTPLVLVELKRDMPISGDIISIPLWAEVNTEAAAVQYEIDYNADRLEPVDVVPGTMVQNLQMSHSETAGKARAVFYNLNGSTFGPSSGELATLNFRLKDGNFGPRDIVFREFMIVNQGSGFIPSEIQGELPTQYSLNQNYPNPFNSSTKISFDLYADGQVDLSVYDLLGRKVATLINQYLPAGTHSFIWNGRSDTGENMASGMFFYRLQSNDFSETKRMLLMK